MGWHELLAADGQKAFAFYGELFDWHKADADIGPMGTYQMFSAGGQTIGAMCTKPRTDPVPFWLYYFNVDNINAAATHKYTGSERSNRIRLAATTSSKRNSPLKELEKTYS